jgi:hypothetical protein
VNNNTLEKHSFPSLYLEEDVFNPRNVDIHLSDYTASKFLRVEYYIFRFSRNS